ETKNSVSILCCCTSVLPRCLGALICESFPAFDLFIFFDACRCGRAWNVASEQFTSHFRCWLHVLMDRVIAGVGRRPCPELRARPTASLWRIHNHRKDRRHTDTQY